MVINVSEDEKRAIKAMAESHKDLCFIGEKFLIRPFKDWDEFLKEGTDLCHAIHYYANNQYRKGEDYLFTMRNVNEPDIPFASLEFGLDGSLLQACKLHNAPARKKEERAAIEAFRTKVLMPYVRERWIEKHTTKQNARADILGFIYDLTQNKTASETTTIENFFANGYCYYFALMLKDAFGGSIRWVKYRSHIVWEDTENHVCYDVYGVFDDYGEYDIVPIDVLGDELETFRHRGRDFEKNIDSLQKETQERVNKYEKANNHPITKFNGRNC